MKKNIYISVVAALLTGAALTSCSDFLEAENKTSGGTTADQYFGNDASSLLVTAYNSLKSIAYQPGLYSQGTDLYIQTRGKAAGEFNEYSLTAASNTVKSFYSNTYKTINYANGVISYAGADSQLGYEARFLRNYGYYLLTQHFGAVPYITKYINDAETNYPRTPLNEVYTAMIEDLTDLYNNSSLESQDHKGHASKQAVAALLAKVYLAAGWDLNTTLNDAAKGTYTVNGTDNFAQAAAWAEKAINGISLSMSFADKWSPFNEGNAEEIFSVQYDRDGYPGDVLTSGHSMQNNFGGYYGECTASGEKSVGSENAPSEKSMYLFEPGDLRFEATYMTTMYNATAVDPYAKTIVANWGGNEGYYAYYNATVDKKTLPIAHRYFPYYATDADVLKEIEANLEQYKNPIIGKDDNGKDVAKYITTDVTIDVLTTPNITRYTFKSDGTYSKATIALTTYNTQTSNGVCVKKFDDPASSQVGSSNDYRDIVLFHVSDMYLVAAEAYLMAGQTAQALTKINAVRNRAGLASLASFNDYNPEYATSGSFTFNALDLVLDERARELYAEGQRWMDLRRTKQLVRYNVEFNDYVGNVAAMSNTQGEIKWYRPIPENELSANTGISEEDQNPGY